MPKSETNDEPDNEPVDDAEYVAPPERQDDYATEHPEENKHSEDEDADEDSEENE